MTSADAPADPDPVPWSAVEAAAPDLAAAVLARFSSARHHVLATLRGDGSPRVSGTEVTTWDGDLAVGSMPGAVKARDLRRDPRFALHAHTGDGTMAGGDAKVAGRALEVTGAAELAAFAAARPDVPDGPFHLFRLRIGEIVHTAVAEDGSALVVRWWTPGGGLREVRRG
ncbi:pyridoxamine 5'-phosphate oxidase family protein [Kineococcus glutinatus]|uniref:Pyridoxamine 5'-phosphate oxidase family protein n=1 Tax=Kineococcus glutinatus TaxID=1070872 RepID=A0ABP9HR68_9ACTN